MHMPTRAIKQMKVGFGVSMVVLLGKAIGFFKQAIIAYYYGLNSSTDVYFAADGFIALVGQIIWVSIPPVIISQRYQASNDAENDESFYYGNNLLIFCIMGIVLSVVIAAFSGIISRSIGIAFNTLERKQLQSCLIMLSPVVFLSALSGCMKGGLELNKIFYPSKMMGMFIGVTTITCVILFNNECGVYAILIGFLLGYASYSFFMMTKIKKVYGHLRINVEELRVKKIVKAFFTVAVGKAVLDISHLFDKIIASSLETGSISSLYYGQIISSDLINATVISVFGMIVLPSFAEKKLKGYNKEFREFVIGSLKRISIIVGAITVVYLIEIKDLSGLFFEHGRFDRAGTKSVSLVATAYAVGFMFVAFREILTNVYYASDDLKTPMFANTISVFVNIITSYLLSRRLGVFGIALATSISMIVACVILYFGVNKCIEGRLIDSKAIRNIVGLCITMIVSFGLGTIMNGVMEGAPAIVRLLVVSAFVAAVYFAMVASTSLIKRKMANIR